MAALQKTVGSQSLLETEFHYLHFHSVPELLYSGMLEILDNIAQLAYKNAKNTFTLPGLGKLVLVNRKARQGRNPATGATIQIPAKRVVKFRVAKQAKEAILGG